MVEIFGVTYAVAAGGTFEPSSSAASEPSSTDAVTSEANDHTITTSNAPPGTPTVDATNPVLVTDLSFLDDDVIVVSDELRVGTPTLTIRPGHLGTHVDREPERSPPPTAAVIQRPQVGSYATALKRAACKPTSTAALRHSPSKKARPSSRWSFTLNDGLALEGVPLVHSGVSDLLDEIDLEKAPP